jgi:hypothetical protein
LNRAFNRLRDQRENAIRRAIVPFWRHVKFRVMSRVKRMQSVGFDVDEIFALGEFRDNFNASMLPQWSLAAWAGIEFEHQWIQSADPQRSQSLSPRWGLFQSVPDAAADPPPTITVEPTLDHQAAVREHLVERNRGVWREIERGVHNRLRRTISKSLSDGDTIAQMSERIEESLDGISRASARRIARTESTGSMNYGSQVERERVGIETKEWLSAADGLTRGADPRELFDHISPDGQIVLNNQPFIVSGEQLLFPGDTSLGASAGNVIQCRCAAAASFDPPTGR